MDLLQSFIENVKKTNLFSKKDNLIIAVSGGVDSTVLCELCKQAGYEFMIAHCNFKLRGKESERDKEFVEGLAKNYGVRIEVKEFETEKFAAENKLSIQEAARKLRYDWFDELVRSWVSGVGSQGNRLRTPDSGLQTLLLTAHHADDNIETILMNFFRGTGLHGLTGMSVKTGHIRRPLLEFSKEQLVTFAKEVGLGYVEDSSNLSSKYTRNYFRNEIIPAISKVYLQVNENLKDNIHRFREIEALYKLAVGEIKKKLCKPKGNEIHIPVKQLTGFNNKALIYEIISDYGFAEKQVEEVIKLCDSGSGKYIASDNFRIIKHRHWLIISPLVSENAENIIIEKGIDKVQFANGHLALHRLPVANCGPLTDPLTACLDAKEIEYPLVLRKWKQGDYFYPLGMRNPSTGKIGKKKLSRFFIDQKLSKTEKENAWVLEMNKRILWVVGYRIDERSKITENTREVLQLTFERKKLL